MYGPFSHQSEAFHLFHCYCVNIFLVAFLTYMCAVASPKRNFILRSKILSYLCLFLLFLWLPWWKKAVVKSNSLMPLQDNDEICSRKINYKTTKDIYFSKQYKDDRARQTSQSKIENQFTFGQNTRLILVGKRPTPFVVLQAYRDIIWSALK